MYSSYNKPPGASDGYAFAFCASVCGHRRELRATRRAGGIEKWGSLGERIGEGRGPSSLLWLSLAVSCPLRKEAGTQPRSWCPRGQMRSGVGPSTLPSRLTGSTTLPFPAHNSTQEIGVGTHVPRPSSLEAPITSLPHPRPVGPWCGPSAS